MTLNIPFASLLDDLSLQIPAQWISRLGNSALISTTLIVMTWSGYIYIYALSLSHIDSYVQPWKLWIDFERPLIYLLFQMQCPIMERRPMEGGLKTTSLTSDLFGPS